MSSVMVGDDSVVCHPRLPVGIGQLDVRSFVGVRRAFPEVPVSSVGALSSLAPRRSGLRSPQVVDYARYMLLRENTWSAVPRGGFPLSQFSALALARWLGPVDDS